MSVSLSHKKKKLTGEISDTAFDRASKSRLKISPRRYSIYLLLTKGYLNQTQVADELKIKDRQTVNYHVKMLEIFGFIEPIDPNGNPKFYKPTPIIPVMSKSITPIVSKSAKKMERTVGKKPILVRDRKSGKIKGWKSSRKIGIVRDYNTIVSVDGKRIPMIRAHSLSYVCSVLREPAKEVPWEKSKDGLKGMEQFVYRHIFDNKKSTWKHPVLFNLKKIEVTFVRKVTKNTDEIVIYMPEKYFLKYELDEAKKFLQEYVWTAWKWFQSRFKAHLAFPIKYREMEMAREIFDPALRRWVHENGMAKVKTKRGWGIVDESKKGFPEREFTTIEQVKADLESPDRILDLEYIVERMSVREEETADATQKVQEQIEKLTDQFDRSSTNLEKIVFTIQKISEETERTQVQLLELAEEVKVISIMQNKMVETIQKNMEQNQTGMIVVEREKYQNLNIDNT